MLLLETIKKANIKFNGKFTYDLTNAARVTDKILIHCPVHGNYTQTARVHLRSAHGCSKCGNVNVSKLQRKTQEQFIAEAVQAHGNKYDYSLVKYNGDSSKITITCPEHGEFIQQAGSHIGKSKCGCKKCAVTAEAKKQRLSFDEVKQRLKLPDHIQVDVSTYTTTKTKVLCNCDYHGSFFQLPEILFSESSGVCPVCAKQLRGWNRSLYKNSPTTLYLLLLTNGLFKVGITKSCNINLRYSPVDRKHISEILFQVTILDGEHAWNIEKQILRELKADRYIGPKIFKDTGNTEIFTTNPLNIITKVINEQLFSIQ